MKEARSSGMSMFKSISKFVGESYTWRQPSLCPRRFELVGDGEVYATVEFQSVFSSKARARCSEGSYSLRRKGLVNHTVTLVREGFEEAVLRLNWRDKGVLQFANGKTYRMERQGHLNETWSFFDSLERTVCSIALKHTLLRYTSEVSFDVSDRKNPDLMKIALIGWYEVVMAKDDDGAAVMIAGLG